MILGILWSYSNNIPDYKFLKNYKPPVSSKVYSGDGELVADFSKEKRIFIPVNSIPKNVINSFLSAEDKNFFSHPGVDAKGVLRAMINNISNIILSKSPAQMNFSPNGRSPDLRLFVACTFPDFHPVVHAEHPSAYSCGGSHGFATNAHHVPF